MPMFGLCKRDEKGRSYPLLGACGRIAERDAIITEQLMYSCLELSTEGEGSLLNGVEEFVGSTASVFQ